MIKRARAAIDLNSMRPDGTTRVWLSDIDTDVQPGQIVTVYEPEDEIAGLGMVERVDSDRGFAFVAVNRGSLQDDDGSLDQSRAFAGTNRAYATVANRRAERTGVSLKQHAYVVHTRDITTQ